MLITFKVEYINFVIVKYFQIWLFSFFNKLLFMYTDT